MPPLMTTTRKFLPTLIIMTAVGPFTLNVPVPVLPLLAKVFETTPEIAQLTLSFYLLGMAFSQIIVGPLSDKFGRRPVIMWGLAIGSFMGLLNGFAQNIEQLIVMRFLQALGATSGIVLGRAMIRDLYERQEAATMISYVNTAMMIAPLLAPLVGGYCAHYLPWWSSSLITALLILIPLIMVYYKLPETNKFMEGRTLKSMLGDFAELITIKEYWGYCLLAAFSSATFFIFLGAAPYIVMTMMGVSPSTYGHWATMAAFGYMAGNLFSARYSHVYGSKLFINIGSVLALLSVVMMGVLYFIGYFTTPFWFFLMQAFYAFSNGLQLPHAMAGALSVNPKVAGSAAGLSGFLTMFVGAIVAQGAGYLVTLYTSVLPVIFLMIITMAIAILSYALLVTNKSPLNQ